jgi:hypothetical protein
MLIARQLSPTPVKNQCVITWSFSRGTKQNVQRLTPLNSAVIRQGAHACKPAARSSRDDQLRQCVWRRPPASTDIDDAAIHRPQLDHGLPIARLIKLPRARYSPKLVNLLLNVEHHSRVPVALHRRAQAHAIGGRSPCAETYGDIPTASRRQQALCPRRVAASQTAPASPREPDRPRSAAVVVIYSASALTDRRTFLSPVRTRAQPAPSGH